MSVRLLHTADWQIGRQFRNIAGDTGAVLREQRFETVRRIAGLAAERRVDAVLVAGDVFDDNAVADETLRRTMHALEGFSGPWVLLPGNHDAAQASSAWSRLMRLAAVPEQVHLALTPDPLVLADGGLCVLPAPLRRRHEPGDVTSWFDAAPSPSGAVRVGLAHGSVANRLPAEAEVHNLIDDRRAERARLDYLALGDWHGTLEIAPRTWYAGTPEPDRFRGNDPGNVLVVEIDAPGTTPRVEPVAVGRYRWLSRRFSLDGEGSVEVLDARLRALDEPGRVLLDLALEGMLDLAARGALDRVLDDARARLRHLIVDEGSLLVTPSDRDLEALGASGFVRASVEALRERQHSAQDDEARAVAVLALRMLWAEQQALEGPGR